MIPDWQQRLIEADINALIEAGYGDLSFRIVDGKLTTWQVTISRKVQVKKKTN